MGAIVDQLVLGRFLADLGICLAKFGKLGTNIEPRRDLGELRFNTLETNPVWNNDNFCSLTLWRQILSGIMTTFVV